MTPILLDYTVRLLRASLEKTESRGDVRKCIRTGSKVCNIPHNNVTQSTKRPHIWGCRGDQKTENKMNSNVTLGKNKNRK